MRNSNRNADLLALGALGLLGFIAIKALTSSNRGTTGATATGSGRRGQLLLPAPRREFVVLYSTHGSDFRFGTANNELPPEPYMTFAEASEVAERFDTTSEAVEGRACVFDVRNGVKYNPYPAAAAQ